MANIVRFHQLGGPEVLKVEEVPAQEPEKDGTHGEIKAGSSMFLKGAIFTLKRPDGAVCDHPGERAILNKAARRLTVNLDFKRILLEYSL